MVTVTETTDAPALNGVANPSSPYRLGVGDSFVGRLDAPSSTGDVDTVAVDLEIGFDYHALLRLDTALTPDSAVNLGIGSARQFSDGNQGFIGDQVREGQTFSQVIRPDAEDVQGAFLYVQGVSYRDGYSVTLLREEGGDGSSLARVDGQGRFEGALGLAAGGVLVDADTDLIGAELEAGTDYTFTVAFDDATGLVPNLFTVRGADGLGVDGADGALAFVANGVGEFNFTPTESGLYFASVGGSVRDAPAPYTVTIAAPRGLDLVDDDGGRELTGTEAADRIDGRGGDDTIRGLSGADTLLGGTGDDRIFGDAGADVLDGNAGDDLLNGGAGDDRYVVDRGDRISGEGIDDGFDTVIATTNYAIRDVNLERIEAAGRGNTRLDSNAEGHEMVGNAGANILVGFGGEDTMTGGAGRDVFVLNPSGIFGSDRRAFTAPEITVTDFTRGQDRIAVDDQLLGLGSPGIDVREFTGAIFRDIRDAGLVGYSARTGELRIDYDGDGDRELVATLEGGTVLGFDDVILF